MMCLRAGRFSIGQLMLLWDPEDSESETHFMGLEAVLF